MVTISVSGEAFPGAHAHSANLPPYPPNTFLPASSSF